MTGFYYLFNIYICDLITVFLTYIKIFVLFILIFIKIIKELNYIVKIHNKIK